VGTESRAEQPAEVRPHRDLPEFYSTRQERWQFVSGLFDNTARYYDRISAVLSFGTCRAYRKRALGRAGLKPGMRLLDAATGTGLVAQAALELGLSSIAGLDPSRGMLLENKRRRSVPLVQGRGENLPFADATFDFISMGYALRHVEDLNLLFGEFYRVLKPGGRVLILEISRPTSALSLCLGKLYLNSVLPAVLRVITRNPDASKLMKFYWATIVECVPPQTILEALKVGGFAEVACCTTGSFLNDYSATKPA